MRAPHDPRPAARLVEHYDVALAAARRYYPGLSRADHEDVVQEAFANVLRRMRRAPLDEPLAYLLRVVYTTGAHALRDRHRSTLSLDDHAKDLDGVELYVDRSATPLSPEEHVLNRLDCDDAWRVLVEELSADERRALALRLVEGRAPAEVAAELGVTARRYRLLLESGGRKLAAGVARARERDHVKPWDGQGRVDPSRAAA
jgi:RNA polymerase sigma factor (sigma-70 family)